MSKSPKSQDTVLYMAGRGRPRYFPNWRDARLRRGSNRNFEIHNPLDFLAQVTQHIPDRSQHLVRYYGHYSNRSRGKRRLMAEAADGVGVPVAPASPLTGSLPWDDIPSDPDFEY